MKKLLVSTAMFVAMTGSQISYAGCTASLSPMTASATCDAAVSMQVGNLVVLKGLDDYDFSNPSANGWDGTAGTNARIDETVCVGTNNIAQGVDVTISSNSGDFTVSGAGGVAVPYNVYFDGSGTAAVHGGANDVTGGVKLDDLTCDDENFGLSVEFTGPALLAATGGVAYSDTVTVTVAPN